MNGTKTILSGVQILLLIAILCPIGIAIFRYFTSKAVQAIFLRNVRSYFSGVIGYLFIIVFVVIAAICSFRPQFFTNNLANLDPLSEYFPMLLLFMVPAITMGAWADERKQGTDELLFTLPVNDVNVLLGKYLAVLAVYTITLCFSLTEVAMLEFLGDPDWGVLATTYLGYWLAGAMLLSAGMFASAITNNATVAFVLGSLLCAVPVFSGEISSSSSIFEAMAESSFFQSSMLSWMVSAGRGIGQFFSFLGLGDLAQSLSLKEQLLEFTQGTIPVSGLMYFVLFTLFMLYLNLVVIRKRHWAADQSRGMKMHYIIRTLALAAILISLHKMAFLGTARADLTAEKIYTLSPVTVETIDGISTERPVTIQAFLSPQVPREFVSLRKQLVGFLKQLDQLGGSRLKVRFIDVEPHSTQADVAKDFGIVPRFVRTEKNGRLTQDEIFMGIVVSRGVSDIVLPFLGAGDIVEYELTRSIRTVSNEKRKTIGILNTDANIMGGRGGWEIVRELSQQYDVEPVSGFSLSPKDKYDALLVVMPSSLTEPEMENLLKWVKAGKPTLIFADPFPLQFYGQTGLRLAPKLPKPPPQQNRFTRQRPQQPPPKADDGKLTRLLRLLEVSWQYDELVWDSTNPHPQYTELPPEIIFITGDVVKDAINPDSKITKGLQEVEIAFAGSIQKRKDSTNNFTPLLLTSEKSGTLKWDEFTQFSMGPMQRQPMVGLKQERNYEKDKFSHVIAAHITASSEKKLNVVFVSDIDMIADWFFQQRSSGESSLKLDNVTFALNALDVLAGDDSFLELRSRRMKLRKLDRVEAQTTKYIDEHLAAKKSADNEAKKEIKLAQKSYDNAKTKIEEDSSLDDQQRDLLLQTLAATVIKKTELAGKEITRQKEITIKKARTRREQQIRSTEARIRYLAILLPPLPAILLGIIVLFFRAADERKNIASDRLVKK